MEEEPNQFTMKDSTGNDMPTLIKKKRRRSTRDEGEMKGKEVNTPLSSEQSGLWTKKDTVTLLKRLCKFYYIHYKECNPIDSQTLDPFYVYVRKYLDNEYTDTQMCDRLTWLRLKYENAKVVVNNSHCTIEDSHERSLYKWADRAWKDPDEEEECINKKEKRMTMPQEEEEEEKARGEKDEPKAMDLLQEEEKEKEVDEEYIVDAIIAKLHEGTEEWLQECIYEVKATVNEFKDELLQELIAHF